MSRPPSLRPHDPVVALQLVLQPEDGFAALARATELSVGEVHNSVGRLRESRLLLPGSRTPSRRNLLEFLIHGVPYAFPATVGAETVGVATAHSGPALAGQVEAGDPVVWPFASGSVRGGGILPLLPSAPALATSNPALYRWLTLVDALRVGRARERARAAEILREEVTAHAPG